MSNQIISNDTKLDVPIRIQRNKELVMLFKLRIPNSTSYYSLLSHVFKMTIVDADGNVKITFDNNRFGKPTEYGRELTISPAESDAFDPDSVYYYDLLVVNSVGYKDYWTEGMVQIVNRRTV